jgi:hypothetical protein
MIGCSARMKFIPDLMFGHVDKKGFEVKGEWMKPQL